LSARERSQTILSKRNFFIREKKQYLIIIYINFGQNNNKAFSSNICRRRRPRRRRFHHYCTSGSVRFPKCILCEVWGQRNYTYAYDDILCTQSHVCAVDDQQPAVVAARDSHLFENNTQLFIRTGCDLHKYTIYIDIRLRHKGVGREETKREWEDGGLIENGNLRWIKFRVL